ncbi:hypothetical protein ACFL1X_09090 [Candidatus Hydrogenedentota bacterium]
MKSPTTVLFVILLTVCPPLSAQDEPALPSGLFDSTPAQDSSETEEESDFELPFDLTGFAELRAGTRTQRDHHERDGSIGEGRLQLEIEKQWEHIDLNITTDLLYDPTLSHHDLDLEEGRGWLELREASVAFTPADFLDVKIGRQILTWGTGDMLFINDLFPKDWKSFFIGRDVEYLKAPSDAVKASFYNDFVNLDVVYTPSFDADRYIDGSRISYWNTMFGARSGKNAVTRMDKPEEWFDDDEIALRLYRNLSGYELALYGYWGFWKSPAGMDIYSGKATFPEISAYGASVRGTIGKGIGNIEIGYYDSEDDRSGESPFIKNSEFRFLVGYEQEIGRDFTMGVQYYLEHVSEHGEYSRTLPANMRRVDKNRQVLTLRLRKLLMNQNLELSLFGYYSPTDQDAYLRPRVHYKIDDHWSAEIGGNVFVGEDDHTFFAQFERNTNVYLAVRYGF